MAYNAENFRKVAELYDEKRERCEARCEERKAEVYRELPEVRKIDQQLAATGLKIMEGIRKGGSASVSDRICEIRAENERLRAQRAMLLKQAGFPEDYTDHHYDCPLCHDTGYVDYHMCECMKKALILVGYESSGLGKLMRDQNFDSFSFAYYENAEQARQSVSALRDFAEHFSADEERSFLICGTTGLGKTHLSSAVAKAVIDRGYDVFYVTAQKLVSDYEYAHFRMGRDDEDPTKRYADCDLLIIDDLGTEMDLQFNTATVYQVLNERINRRAPTIVNTNLMSGKALEDRYGARIASRLCGEFRLVYLSGTDIRRRKLEK